MRAARPFSALVSGYIHRYNWTAWMATRGQCTLVLASCSMLTSSMLYPGPRRRRGFACRGGDGPACEREARFQEAQASSPSRLRRHGLVFASPRSPSCFEMACDRNTQARVRGWLEEVPPPLKHLLFSGRARPLPSFRPDRWCRLLMRVRHHRSLCSQRTLNWPRLSRRTISRRSRRCLPRTHREHMLLPRHHSAKRSRCGAVAYCIPHFHHTCVGHREASLELQLGCVVICEARSRPLEGARQKSAAAGATRSCRA